MFCIRIQAVSSSSFVYRSYLQQYSTCTSSAEIEATQDKIMQELEDSYNKSRTAIGVSLIQSIYDSI